MASLGDVTFTLRGETASFQTAMKGAASAVEELQRDVKLMQADFRSGRIGIDEYRRSMAATRDQAKALAAGVHDLSGKELSQLNTVLKQTTPAVEKVGLSLRSLRGPLATIAADAVGVKGTFGSLASMLISLGVGGAAGVAAIAGIGAIGFAIRKLTTDTSEAHKAYVDWLNSVTKDGPLVITGAEMDRLTARVVKLSNMLVQANRADPMSMYAQNLRRSLTEAVGELATVQKQYQDIFDGQKFAARDTTKAVNEWKGATLGAADALKSLNDQFNAWMTNTVKRPILFTRSFVLGEKDADQVAASKKVRDGIVGGVEEAAKMLDGKDLLPPELTDKIGKEAERLGASMSRSVAAGFMSGNSIGSAVKNVFRSVFETVIAELIKPFLTQLAATVLSALGKGAGGKFGIKDLIGAGVGVGISVLTGGIFSRSSETVINVPASRSPMDQARDAWWLSTMSETMRALQSNNSLRVVYTR